MEMWPLLFLNEYKRDTIYRNYWKGTSYLNPCGPQHTLMGSASIPLRAPKELDENLPPLLLLLGHSAIRSFDLGV